MAVPQHRVDLNVRLGRIRTIFPACHPEQAKRAEGSSHFRCAVQAVCAKILRLPAVAQDDKLGALVRIRPTGCVLLVHAAERS